MRPALAEKNKSLKLTNQAANLDPVPGERLWNESTWRRVSHGRPDDIPFGTLSKLTEILMLVYEKGTATCKEKSTPYDHYR